MGVGVFGLGSEVRGGDVEGICGKSIDSYGLKWAADLFGGEKIRTTDQKPNRGAHNDKGQGANRKEHFERLDLIGEA